jgi:hypothetical protein
MSENQQHTALEAYQVVWADAHSDSSGWTSKRDVIHEEGEYLVHTIGWLLTEGEGGKENHVSLCQSYTPDEDVDHILHIPQGMVRKISRIFLSET